MTHVKLFIPGPSEVRDDILQSPDSADDGPSQRRM